MKARKTKPTMQDASVNGEQGKRRRTKPVRTHDQTKGPQKRKGGACLPADELFPCRPLPFELHPDSASVIDEFADRCSELEADYRQMIEDFVYVPHEQLSLEQKREERSRELEIQRRLRRA